MARMFGAFLCTCALCIIVHYSVSLYCCARPAVGKKQIASLTDGWYKQVSQRSTTEDDDDDETELFNSSTSVRQPLVN